MSPEPPEALSRGLLLVVDDSLEMLEFWSGTLGVEHEVIIASSGQEGLRLAVSEHPDLILLDIVMPVMDGYSVCAQLKDFPATADIPVIFLTGRTEEEDEARGLGLGAIDFIHKPVNPLLLKARVRNHLEVKRSRDALKGLVFSDGLTGVANRRQFEWTFEAEWTRSMRSRRPISLIMADVDHFKRYNDALGHPAGDGCLRGVARAMTAAVQRSTDLLARYGGEEFACILPETDGPSARLIAGQIQSQVAALAMPHPDSPVGPVVTLSLGVATLVADVGTHQQVLLEAADEALYQAKHGGRSRVVHALDAVPLPPRASAGKETVGPDPSGPHILLVEDDTRMAAVLRVRLETQGTPLTWVTGADAALGLLKGGSYSLILSDVVMPGIDGFEFCKRAKADPRLASVPFALLTSLSRNLRERSLQAGADDYLSKLEEEMVFTLRTRSLLELGVRRVDPGSWPSPPLLLLSPSAHVRAQAGVHLAGLDLAVASSLAEGRDRMRQTPPSLLLLDLELHGPDTIAWILDFQREAWGSRVVILLLATKAEDALLPEYLDLVDDRLSKPLEAAETRHRVGLMLRLARGRSAPST